MMTISRYLLGVNYSAAWHMDELLNSLACGCEIHPEYISAAIFEAPVSVLFTRSSQQPTPIYTSGAYCTPICDT